ncbi:hypothetical protein UPYG_G00082990 [Umbra pygmaea]|uniref:Stereocilin LRR domain-containing protein n=1 Tax=Umbra pygmaea TaxID=75934 RepID=A0ABD0XE27_UMBPY
MVCDDAREVRSLPISRQSPTDKSNVDRNIKTLIKKMHALSNNNINSDAHGRSRISRDNELSADTSDAPDVSSGPMHEGIDYSADYGALSSVLAMYGPLAQDGFFENLPKTVVCILSGRKDCGLEAELTRTVSLELGKPLLTLLSSVKSQTCSTGPTISQPLFLRSFFRFEDATVEQFTALQELIMNALSNFPMSNNFMSAWSGLIDIIFPTIVKYGSELLGTFLQSPIDYVKIALQFGIPVPALDDTGQCQQGDLKQLLMWGMSHNVSWSFGESILDMLLPPDSTMCNYPGPACQPPPVNLFCRTLKTAEEKTAFLLRCDYDKLALFNNTLCAQIITEEFQNSTTLYNFCDALSILNHTEVKHVWSNTCLVVKALLSHVLEDNSDCSGETPPPTVQRVSRALNLNQLLCNYDNWISNATEIDAGLVTLCSENDREEFIVAVCNNFLLMQALQTNPINDWLWSFCLNSSVGFLVSQFCSYSSWTVENIDPSFVALCWDQDRQGLKNRLCENLTFFMIVFSNVDNIWLIPNCTEAATQPDDTNSLVETSCRYSEWQNVMAIATDIISMCIQYDEQSFIQNVCANTTFLNILQLNSANVWVGDYCKTVSLISAPTHPTVMVSSLDWCNQMDLAHCAALYPVNFTQKVCSNATVLQNLLANLNNTWLLAYCVNTTAPVGGGGHGGGQNITNTSSTDSHVSSSFNRLLCSYANWTDHVSEVNATLVMLCSENNEEEFIVAVCNNFLLMQVLQANPVYDWLWSFCVNSSQGFLVSQYCRYSDWTVENVNTSMVTFCWDHDQQKLKNRLCENLTFFMIVFSNVDNIWLIPNCTEAATQPDDTNSLVETSCRYSEWQNVMAIATDIISMCIQYDEQSFIQNVCANTTFLNILQLNSANVWVGDYCKTVSLISAPTHPTVMVSSLDWCNQMDLAHCAALYPVNFTRKVCSNTTVLQNLLANLNNTWLLAYCVNTTAPVGGGGHGGGQNITNTSSTDSQVSRSFNRFLCNYTNWTDHTSEVNASVVTLCSINDTQVFSLVVCNNTQLIKALVISSENSWLWNFCGNFSKSLKVNQFCSYGNWTAEMVDPIVVKFCWQQDQMGFQKNVCCNLPLFEKLTLQPENKWLLNACVDNNTMDILPQVCHYSDWNQPVIVDMTDLALCAERDSVNFIRKVCNNTTVLQNLLANMDNMWLLAYCANQTFLGGGGGQGGGLTGFKSVDQCLYPYWTMSLPDARLLALCWYHDFANFVSSVCTNAVLVCRLTKEPSNLWVGTVCTPYTDPNTQDGINSDCTDSQPCLVREIVRRLNLSCATDFSPACQPGSSQTQALQLLLRCVVDILQPRLKPFLTRQVTSTLEQATTLAVVLLVALEEQQMIYLPVTENIHLSVLETVVLYLEETNFENKRVLLQCFEEVLNSLMQSGRDVTSDRFFLIKEYFRIPLASLKSVLSAVNINTVREIVLYYSRNQATLQLTSTYLSTMVSVFFQNQLVLNWSLFPDLTPLLSVASPADIQSLPSLQTDFNVRNTINNNIRSLSEEQRRAFGRWYNQALSSLNITAGGLSFIRDTGNLSVYLPFQSFQHLSPAQLLDGLDVLLINTLTTLQQQFVADSIIRSFSNLTAQQFRKLGYLTCLSDPVNLLVYRNTKAFSVIQDNIRTCVAQGISVPSDMVFSWLLNGTELQSPGSLSAGRVAELAPILPWVGVDILLKLNPLQLSPALTALSSVPFTPAQASVIVDKVSLNFSLSLPGQLRRLGSLVSGVKVETLWNLTSDTLLSSLPDMAQHTPSLNALQANAISTKLWSSPNAIGWLDKLEPLLPSTPLICVMARARSLVINSTSAARRAWNTQQAKTLFNEAVKTNGSLSLEKFLALGNITRGISCTALQQLFKIQPSFSSVRSILALLRVQSVPLYTSLKRCIIEKLYNFNFFPQLLGDFGAQIALALPMSIVARYPTDMMDTLRKMIVQEPQYFLLLPSIKQDVLVDKILQRLGMYTGDFTENEFRSLGVMATYVVDEVFVQLVRSFFVDNMEFLRKFCYNSSKRDIVAQILQEPATFGPVQNWTQDTLNQVDRFLFFLPQETLQRIPQALMTQGRIEWLFLSQHQWESGFFGGLCVQRQDQAEQTELFGKQQFVLQYFLGFLGRIPPKLSPTCEKLHTTQPSAWSINSLTGMSSSAFSCSLELFGQDPFFSPYEQSVIFQKTKEIYGAARSFSPSVITQLGRIASQLSVDELSVIRLSELSTFSALGTVSTWNSRQLAVLASSVLNSTKLGPSQLDSSTLVATGYILCGMKVSDMRSLNPVEFSKAVLWLGRLSLACSEEQMQTLVGLLSSSRAFGPLSTWGSEVFIEIGSLAAGIPDIDMSSLVEEQIEGLAPLAVSLIPAKKFATVFSPSQISMFSYEQAEAVTDAQRLVLSMDQLTALSRALTDWDNRPIDIRGRSSGGSLFPLPLWHLMGLLMLLLGLP